MYKAYVRAGSVIFEDRVHVVGVVTIGVVGVTSVAVDIAAIYNNRDRLRRQGFGRDGAAASPGGAGRKG